MTAISDIPAPAQPTEAQRDVRGAILAAAARLFAERGYAATSVREVVDQAGCKKPTLYYYFQSKERLYLEVIEATVSAIGQVVDDSLAGPGTVYERMQRSLHAYLDHARTHTTELRLLMAAERHPEEGQPSWDFDAVRQEHIERVRSLFAEGVRSGELRDSFDFEEAVLAFFGIVDHRLVLFLHGRPLPDDLPERLLDLFFNGVRA